MGPTHYLGRIVLEKLYAVGGSGIHERFFGQKFDSDIQFRCGTQKLMHYSGIQLHPLRPCEHHSPYSGSLHGFRQRPCPGRRPGFSNRHHFQRPRQQFGIPYPLRMWRHPDILWCGIHATRRLVAHRLYPGKLAALCLGCHRVAVDFLYLFIFLTLR